MKQVFAAALVALSAGPALAQDFDVAMRAYLEAHVAAWANDPVLVEAIRAQNARHAGLGAAEIEAMDQTWRSEVDDPASETIRQVLDNPAADFLRARVAESGGAITEVFVMDALGLNVAASAATSDYWQGDEEKFTETYPLGKGAVHTSDVEFDESSQSFQGQISVPVVDMASGEVVGAMTVGVDAEALF